MCIRDRYKDVNLNAIITLKNAFKLPVGYSDHTIGIEIPVAAAAMGAKIIEKHFTLDRGMEGPDHKASLEPDELKKMVDGIRNVEKAFGDGIKRCNLSEENTKKVARKSIVARNNLKKGQKLSLDDIAFKRPQIGVKPVYVNLIIGKKLIRDLDKDELITFDLIE